MVPPHCAFPTEVAGYAADVLTRQSLTQRPTAQENGDDGQDRSDGRHHRDGAPGWSPAEPRHAEVAARHIALALRASSPDQHRGWVAVLRQLEATVAALRDAQAARGDLAAATALTRHASPALASITLHVDTARPQILEVTNAGVAPTAHGGA